MLKRGSAVHAALGAPVVSYERYPESVAPNDKRARVGFQVFRFHAESSIRIIPRASLIPGLPCELLDFRQRGSIGNFGPWLHRNFIVCSVRNSHADFGEMRGIR